MLKNILFSSVLLLTGLSSFAQLYRKPSYPQNYFRWPVGLTPDIVANLGELRPNHWHMGLDVRTNAKVNQNVYAAADGYIAFVGIEPLSWGRWIIINHPNGMSTLYGHLNNFRADLEAYVKQHQYSTGSWETHLSIPAGRFPVKKGDFISFSGTTGGSGGPHVHWEIIDTRSDRRLNPTLFGVPITDNVAPTILKLAMYDRNNSVYDQAPVIFKLTRSAGVYSVPGNSINTNLNKLSFAIQAYDTRDGTGNQDGIYSARLFFDGREISSFYIDSIDYDDTRYMNSQIDYKMVRNGGSWMQHVSKLPGDHSGVYHDLGAKSLINLDDTALHNVRIEVSDAEGNLSNVNFNIRNNGAAAPPVRGYDWLPNRPNKVLAAGFEAYLPVNAIYDKMNNGYSSSPSAALNSVSAKHTLGSGDIPAHSNFEVRIRPIKPISVENRNRIVIKRTSNTSTVKKATWNGDWMTAQFRDFGSFEAFIDNAPPEINAPGSGDVINLNKTSRISFTPKDNYAIASFRAEVDGKWLRFTNDKGRTWLYYFDEKVTPGQHTLTVTVTDIAGNKTTRSWQFIRGVNPTPVKAEPEENQDEEGEMDEEGSPVAKPASANALDGARTSLAPVTKKAGTATAIKKTAVKSATSKTGSTGKTTTVTRDSKSKSLGKSSASETTEKKTTKAKKRAKESNDSKAAGTKSTEKKTTKKKK